MRKNVLLLMLIAVLCMALLAGCGGSSGGGSEKAEEKAEQEGEFLLGSWFAKEARKGDDVKDPEDLFGDTFSLYFNDNNECTMWVGQNKALVKWELTDDGAVLKGDDTYNITFPDDEHKTLVITINDFDVLMEKYEE